MLHVSPYKCIVLITMKNYEVFNLCNKRVFFFSICAVLHVNMVHDRNYPNVIFKKQTNRGFNVNVL